MNDKLPDGVVLAMERVEDNQPCLNCYFFSNMKKCPTEWKRDAGGFVTLCANNRNVFFREIGESDE
jgi:hypothetical protein